MSLSFPLLSRLALLVIALASPVLAQMSPKAAIEAVNKQFSAAVEKKDAAAVAALYTDDAIVLPPNLTMVKGRADIKNLFEGFLASGIKGIAFTTIEVESFGDTAIEVGEFVLTGPDGSVADRGKSVVVWKRIKGQWKLHRDIFNTSLPPTGR